jgi:tetratricopeptide (TPR) repeat protein
MEMLCRHLVRTQGDPEEPAFAIHRSLQKNLLFRLDRDKTVRQNVFERTMKIIRNAFPVQSPIGVPVNDKWSIYERYLPHVLTLHTMYSSTNPPLTGTASFADLLCDAGYYMWDRNMGLEGIPILETAGKICLLDENRHLRRLRANIGVAIGSLWNTIGISMLHQVIPLFDEILMLRQEHNAELPLPHSQDEQLLLSNAWNDKGWFCLESENYAAAEDCFEKSLSIKRQWTEKDIPFEFAETIKNIAFVRLSQKNSGEALELVRHALQLVEEDPAYGPYSGTVQKFRLYMTGMLANSGKIKEAIELADKVAMARKVLYRPFHPFNLDVCYIQGVLAYKDGRLLDAEDKLRQSLDSDVRDPYPDECKARCLYALSEVEKELGKHEEAEAHRTEAFKLLDRWRDLFFIEVSKDTHESVLFDHVVPLKCTRMSQYGKLWVGHVR